MKNISYLLVMIVLSVIVTSVGCKKKSGDDSATKDQYVGTWQGAIVFNDGQAHDGTATISIRLSDGILTGFLSVQNDPLVYRVRQIAFVEGVMNVALICSTPEEEDCKNWSISGSITLTGNVLTMNLAGTFCGSGGGTQATLTGTLSKTSGTPDDSTYINFAQAGREWRYKVTGFDGTECLLKFFLADDLGNGVFSGMATNDCNWQWEQQQFWWYVSPQVWCDMQSASLNTRILNIMSDAKVGDIYETITGNDTITITVLSLDDQVIIDGKTYPCIKVRKKGVQFGGHYEGYVWLHFSIGMIKYEAIEPNKPHDVHLEELIWRNF